MVGQDLEAPSDETGSNAQYYQQDDDSDSDDEELTYNSQGKPLARRAGDKKQSQKAIAKRKNPNKKPASNFGDKKQTSLL